MTIIKIHNVETGEIIERDMTAEELKQLELDRQSAAKYVEAENEIKAKKEAAQGKLAALGLTAEDLQALGL
jgi:hypothetical protein